MTQATPDPDRFFDRQGPGAHEWWYFDAISDDGRDALVIVWYAGLPFDPSYGVATLRHLKNPARYPAPRALDHSAIGFSWYRDGKTLAYALNGHRADAFRHHPDPFAVEVATSRFERQGGEYRLTVDTPSVDRRPIRAEVRFVPADATEPFERDLGRPDAPHDWMLAASDCRVEGTVTVGGESLNFAGRGYHDHNAGAEEMAVAMKRWEWGRVHHGPFAEIYYESTPRVGEPRALWITTRDGRPEVVHEGEELELGTGEKWGDKTRSRNVFGLDTPKARGYLPDGLALWRTIGPCLDDGPFYRRWLADFEIDGDSLVKARGIAELLETRHLHKAWFNWMIPYRLKWPGRS